MTRSILSVLAALVSLTLSATPASAQYGYPTYPLPPVPSHPILITQPTIQGVTPWGGYHTGNTMIQNSVFAPGRTESLNNGSAQQINRPVYGSQGNLIGYQQGLAWQNSLTGQWHHQVRTVTPNSIGGAHTEVSVGDYQEEKPRRGR